MTSRKKRAAIAQETVRALEDGFYTLATGERVEIAAALHAAKSNTRLYRPNDFPEPPGPVARRSESTRFEVTNETTLHAARRLVNEQPPRKVLALNFASAKNPGGGFRGGSQAQEESLARASGLYACLMTQWEYYETNRASGTSLYTDHMIYSPDVPVFRNDNDGLLDAPFPVSILTVPAANAGAIRTNEPGGLSRLEPVMRQRTSRLLSVAAEQGDRTLVLGAWGCGVFRNDPVQVAAWFAECLKAGGPFENVFDHVAFAVLDSSPDLSTLTAFEDEFC